MERKNTLLMAVLGLAMSTSPNLRANSDFPEYGIHHIKSVPVTISYPGIYVFDHDLVFTPVPGGHGYDRDNGTAIQINASNVLLDLNGHSLSDPSTYFDSNSIGIEVGSVVVSSGYANVLIFNGTINGFASGVFANGKNLVAWKIIVRNQVDYGILVAPLNNGLIDHCQAHGVGVGPNGEILAEVIQQAAGFDAWEVRNSLVETFPDQIGIVAYHLAIGNTLKDGYLGILFAGSATQANNTFINVVYPWWGYPNSP